MLRNEPHTYPQSVSKLRAATFNVHHCEGIDGRVDVGRIADVIKRTEADLIALQELDRGMPRSDGTDQPAELERLTGMTVTFHPTLSRGGGEYGIAVAARGEAAFDLKPLPRIADEEPRGLQVGEYRGVTVFATHLSLRRAPRVRQTAALISAIERYGGPFLLLGDLNQSSWALRRAARGAFYVPVVPRRTMARRWAQRDHVVAGRGARVTGRDVIPGPASDHYALVADVAIP